MYLPANIYDQLYAYLSSEVDQATADAFDSYFADQPVDGRYQCTDYDGYMHWLEELIPDGDYGLFVAWDQNNPSQSGQGGTFKITF